MFTYVYLHIQKLFFPELFGNELHIWWPITSNSLKCVSPKQDITILKSGNHLEYSMLSSYRSDSYFIGSIIIVLFIAKGKKYILFSDLGYSPGLHVRISCHVASVWNNYLVFFNHSCF